jgi:lipopolysaccharide transport system permease protein
MSRFLDAPSESRAHRDATAPRAERQPVLTIRPARSRRVRASEIWQQRDLLFILAGRDIKVRYRQTVLGASWVVLQPLLVSGIFTFVFGRVANLPSEGVPYFVFSFAGLLCWNQFNNLLLRISGSLLQNTSLVAKVYFPRLILPFGAVLSTMVDFAVSFALMLVLLRVGHVAFTARLLLLPVWLVLVTLLACGVGLVAAGLVVRYRDINYVTPLFLQLLLYGSPVAYATSAIPDRFKAVFAVNPLVGLLDAFRWSLLPHSPLHRGYVLYSVVASVLLFALGTRVFRAAERTFADVI